MAWDIYRHVAVGEVGDEFKVQNPIGFNEFLERCAVQMMHYNPAKLQYAGDEFMRAATQTLKRKRPTGTSAVPQKYLESRKIGNLEQLERHAKALVQVKNAAACVMCGDNTYYRSTLCKNGTKATPVHPLNARDVKHQFCFLRFHDSSCIGLCKGDTGTKGVKSWKPASESAIKRHRRKYKHCATDT